MNVELLNEMIEQKFVRVNKHPTEELYIYNYTQTVQYNRIWNEVTMSCRGLIMDKNHNIIARPFSKFFNYGERLEDKIPNLPFEVYDKMDGSLGILYWIDNAPYIASRGSFDSDQSKKATEMLHTKYRPSWERLERSKTYLFEIIYPENRIVINYGNEEKLVLLAVIDTQSGSEESTMDIGFSVVKRYDGIKDVNELLKLQIDNKEGFIVKFSNNYRLKIKFEEYVRLHRIITQVSNTAVWELLKDGKSFEELIDRVPDEFFQWLQDTIKELQAEYKAIEDRANAEFKILESRKETAEYFISCTYPSVLFKMYDKKDYCDLIWKLIKPKFEKPFQNEEN